MTLTSLATSSSFSVTDLMSNTTAIPAVLCTDWINSSTGKRETQKIRWGKDGDIEKSNTKPGELQWQPPAWYCSELERIFRAKSYNAEKRRTLHVKTRGSSNERTKEKMPWFQTAPSLWIKGPLRWSSAPCQLTVCEDVCVAVHQATQCPLERAFRSCRLQTDTQELLGPLQYQHRGLHRPQAGVHQLGLDNVPPWEGPGGRARMGVRVKAGTDQFPLKSSFTSGYRGVREHGRIHV